jgi:dTDP-4-amino-4,6-dideoxygalactose transaminase
VSDLVSLPWAGDRSCDPSLVNEHGWYRYLFQVNVAALRPNWTRQRIVDEIANAGYPAFVGPCPEIYLERAFDDTGWRPATRLPRAKALGEASIAMLVHPTIPRELANRAGEAAAAVISEATRGNV